MTNNIKAFIDLGTNTFHCMIVQFNSEFDYEIIFYEKIFVKIGVGIADNVIAEEAISRAQNAIKYFNKECIKHSTNSVTAVGTSALRNAKNASELIGLMQSFNWEVKVIDGKREAELIYKGILLDHSLNTQYTILIMDIGGGSVEFIIASNKKLLWSESFEIGAQRLKDKFHQNDPIGQDNLSQLHSYLELSLESLLSAVNEFHPKLLIGSSGTFDTLREMANPDNPKSSNQISLKDFLSIYKDLINSTQNERLEIKGLIQERAEMIVVAVSLLNFILAKLDFKEFFVSNFALKEGLIFEEINSLNRNG